VERAGLGTLYLDEVSALPVAAQGKLLRLVEDGSYRRLGSAEELVSHARVVSSSNADLAALAADGRFRADLYYRINATELCIPPLRARPEDVVPLSEHLLVEFARRDGNRPPTLTPAATLALRQHPWPGNVRELRNRIERAVGLSAGASQIPATALFPERGLFDRPPERVASLAEARERAERAHIEETLRHTNGSVMKAASLLGISRTTLWEKMRKLGLYTSGVRP
jgi:transcriptional regulator with PAS, ATPase and Fis domain